MNAETLYTRDILRLAASIPFLVRFEELGDGVELRSATCGSRMRAAVELDEDGRVTALRLAVEACAFGQAAAALMARGADGKNAADARADLRRMEAWLGGGAAPPYDPLAPVQARKGRHGAVLLPFRTLLAAIEEAGR